MSFPYGYNIENHAQMPRRLMSPDLPQHQSNAHTLSDRASHLPTATRPLPSVSVAPIPILPPHREWKDLDTLELPAIMTHLRDLTERCTITRDAHNAALVHLEMSTQILLSKHSPISSWDMDDYVSAFTKARLAGRNIFAPQEAYRSAVATLGLLVSDLIDVLPADNDIKEDVRARFNEGMSAAGEKEENVRKVMRGLADERSKGHGSFALVVYLNTARQRLKNWDEEEKRFKAWAGECIGELRHGDEGWLS